ncbi:MAG: CDP-alcohol phosphatidyltransferase family protein [archaeon]|nr:CDP-alcohol phosphatidyltransferase family protein [archaeon]
MLEGLRPKLTNFLEPIAKRLNINPNIITIISPFIAVISAYWFANHNLILGGLFILLSGFLDVVDGAVARRHGRSSPFGAFLDSTMDRFADAIIYIGIIFGGYCHWFVGILAIHSAITVSYVRSRAETQGIECSVGIAERAVRLLILVAGSLIIGFVNFIGLIHTEVAFTYVIYLLIILSYFTVCQRVYHTYKELNKLNE